MELPAVFVIAGAVFLLVGVLGGGFEVKELRVPTVDKPIRLILAVVGVVFIAGGLVLHGLPGDARNSRAGPTLTPSTSSTNLTPASPSATTIRPNGVDSVAAEATHKYWEDCRSIDRYLEERWEALETEYKRGRQDSLSRAELLDRAASLQIEGAKRERALPIQNVDTEITELFADGRTVHQHKADTWRQQARLLREEASLSARGLPVPREMRFEWNRLSDALEELNDEGKVYSRKWESLRIRLTQKYNRNFSG